MSQVLPGPRNCSVRKSLRRNDFLRRASETPFTMSPRTAGHTGAVKRSSKIVGCCLGLMLAVTTAFGQTPAQDSASQDSASPNSVPQDLAPQSPEAWAYVAGAGKADIGSVYAVTADGLVCNHNQEKTVRVSIETLAAAEHIHPARVAEGLAAYLWSDWTLLYVVGPPVRAALDGGQDTLTVYLETFYQAHHVCLLGILKTLVDGYEGDYLQTENGFVYKKRGGGARYRLLAFEPKYFPGNGLLEPLGIVQAVRNADLLRVDAVRAKVFDAIAVSAERRAAEGGDPLKIER